MSEETMDIDDDIMNIFNLSGTPSVDVPENTPDPDRIPEEPIKLYPVAPKKGEIVNVTIDERKDQAQTDYDFSRKTLHHSIEQGSCALDELVLFAKNSGGPEAFKQVGGIMDSIAKSAKQLLDLQSQLKSADQSIVGGKTTQQAQTINNNTTIVEQGGKVEHNETREEAMDRRKAERAERAERTEKQVN